MSITNALWRVAALHLAGSPATVALIRRLAARTPYYDIYGADGTLYMRRWWLMPRWCLRDDPSQGCAMPRPWLPFSVRMHHIVRPDADRHLHDHPFNFRTLVLTGGYREQTKPDGPARPVLPGDTYRSPARRFHRIAEVTDDGAWTLFIMGRRINGWGFLVDGRKVPWREYLQGRGQ